MASKAKAFVIVSDTKDNVVYKIIDINTKNPIKLKAKIQKKKTNVEEFLYK